MDASTLVVPGQKQLLELDFMGLDLHSASKVRRVTMGRLSRGLPCRRPIAPANPLLQNQTAELSSMSGNHIYRASRSSERLQDTRITPQGTI